MKYKMQADANKNQTLIGLSQARSADRVDTFHDCWHLWSMVYLSDGDDTPARGFNWENLVGVCLSVGEEGGLAEKNRLIRARSY